MYAREPDTRGATDERTDSSAGRDAQQRQLLVMEQGSRLMCRRLPCSCSTLAHQRQQNLSEVIRRFRAPVLVAQNAITVDQERSRSGVAPPEPVLEQLVD